MLSSMSRAECCILKIANRLAAVQVTCQICFESFPVQKMHASVCSHYFCRDCWQGYVTAAISEGPSALNLRCPLPDCKAAVRSILGQTCM